ncbi:hypothetical protein M427DRAFT_53637 [Gonapodya prolifera JEL478]|uniref:Actin-crosslinking protein n=1 Tax=Gonapodya prolifera (strain JEL478) TaxID=1344416 RepID=A0A139AQB0_GONPJ|nr:hypothetical protein M427DRAFT_53637 [Gonapodya prolifera JEL478]|eukprot:KXS18693.1 hypothetical protein M427DRAFT_53637 [Gonapodya prolifera JEL478]
MSDLGKAVGGRLRFKGEPTKKKKKKRKAEGDSGDEVTEGWINADSMDDIAGPLFFVTTVTDPPSSLCTFENSNVVSITPAVPPSESSSDPTSISALEPSSVTQVFVAKRANPSVPVFSLKSAFNKYLSCDKFGLVTCEQEAVGPLEEWDIIFREDGVAIKHHVYDKFLKADSVALKTTGPRSGNVVRADSENVGFAEVWRVRCQAETRAAVRKEKKKRRGLLDEGGQGVAEDVGDVDKFEVDQIKKFHTWGLGRLVTPTTTGGEAIPKTDLKRALKQGKLHEALLDRRTKLKHDKFC